MCAGAVVSFATVCGDVSEVLWMKTDAPAAESCELSRIWVARFEVEIYNGRALPKAVRDIIRRSRHLTLTALNNS